MVDKLMIELKYVYFVSLLGVLLYFGIIEFLIMDFFLNFELNPEIDFILQCILILLTFGTIYITLRFHKIKKVEQALISNPETNFIRYSYLRYFFLDIAAILNISYYMISANSSSAWMATILILAFPFVYPSKERFYNETHFAEK